ncbi:MAG TPA: carboxypeptidase-like regulatory domain-containing protein [Candidatus Thermoplasmatota archaeon]|nr:carboxypeptidase-like regulatory domain-containing protein [Candidatus Thermoplasmatota archaeon]
MKLALLLGALLLAAGCTGGGPRTAEAGATVAGDATAGGAIGVTVTTSEISPVAGAEVVLWETAFRAVTDAGGRADFKRLEPGRYTIVATKEGYASVDAKGRVVDVAAGETAEVRLQLDALPPDAEMASHVTHPMAGFIVCSVDVHETGPNNACRGAYVGPHHVGDPSDKTIHHWMIEVGLRGILNEARWTPNQEALGKDLAVTNFARETCNPDCVWDDPLSSVAGPSPLRLTTLDGPEQLFTKKLGKDPRYYPILLHTNVRASCPATCPAAVMLQQRYDLWTTAFYGADPSPAFTVLPPG